jgi:hypothetical protein
MISVGLPADLHEDGFVDYDDLLEFVNVWLCPQILPPSP